jgi:hypothetical protein
MSVRSQQRSKYKVHESFDAQTVTWNAGSQFRERFCEVGCFLDLPGTLLSDRLSILLCE